MAKLDLLSQVNARTGTVDAGAVSLNVKDIPIGEITVKENVRADDSIETEGLKESIRKVGLLQPITVYKSDSEYVCLMGHRRLKAYRELYGENKDRYHSIRCIIADDKNITVKQLIENVQREDLKPLELYNALKGMKAEGMSNKQIGDVIGKAKGYIDKIFTAINDIDTNPEIHETMRTYAGVSMDDIQETKGIEHGKRKEILKAKGEKKITRKQLREKVTAIKRSGKPERKAEIRMDKAGLFIEISCEDKDTFAILSADVLQSMKRRGIKRVKG